jgi:hypothetical protein
MMERGRVTYHLSNSCYNPITGADNQFASASAKNASA